MVSRSSVSVTSKSTGGNARSTTAWLARSSNTPSASYSSRTSPASRTVIRNPAPASTLAGSATGSPVGRNWRTHYHLSLVVDPVSRPFRGERPSLVPGMRRVPGYRPALRSRRPEVRENAVSGRHSADAGRERLAAVRRELGVPMYRNAYALMLNTVVNSALGLVYWVVAARTSSPGDVGRGNALIPLVLRVSFPTRAAFGQALTRSLPRAGAAAGRFVLPAYGTAVGPAVVAAPSVMAWCALRDPPTPC